MYLPGLFSSILIYYLIIAIPPFRNAGNFYSFSTGNVNDNWLHGNNRGNDRELQDCTFRYLLPPVSVSILQSIAPWLSYIGFSEKDQLLVYLSLVKIMNTFHVFILEFTCLSMFFYF